MSHLKDCCKHTTGHLLASIPVSMLVVLVFNGRQTMPIHAPYSLGVGAPTIPCPMCGVIVVGSDIITYCSASQPPRSAPIRSTVIKSFGRIDPDGSRYLLSDHQFCLAEATLKVHALGWVAPAQSLSFNEALQASCAEADRPSVPERVTNTPPQIPNITEEHRKYSHKESRKRDASQKKRSGSWCSSPVRCNSAWQDMLQRFRRPSLVAVKFPCRALRVFGGEERTRREGVFIILMAGKAAVKWSYVQGTMYLLFFAHNGSKVAIKTVARCSSLCIQVHRKVVCRGHRCCWCWPTMAA
eukprot:scaffold138424_cov21-Tisochrysis_lutea.AAC.1